MPGARGQHGDAADLVDRARRLADDVLFPDAQIVDCSSIPASHFEALRAARLFSLADTSASDARRVMASVASGCGATFFVWVQHHGVVRTVAASDNDELRNALLPALLDGSVIGGTAFAHVRRVGSTPVRATRVDGGWRLDGRAPWATSWGIAERLTVAAATDNGQMIWSVLPGDGGPGVIAHPLDLPVFSATGTVAIQFDGAMVADADVLAVDDVEAWREVDRVRSSAGSPAVLGVAERAIRLLGDAARGDNDPAHATAGRLRAGLAERWSTDDELTAHLAEPPRRPEDVADLIATASSHRAACLDLGHRATTALLAAIGGGGMDLGHPAQRLAREAAFYVIQAQTADGRSATLDAV